MKRIIIVTGASSGLGREFALQLSAFRTADEIWLLARRREKLDDTASDILSAASKSGRSAPLPRTFDIDLSGKGGVHRFEELLVRETASAMAAGADGIEIDTLVNNAGFGTYGPFIETDLSRELDMIELNVTALTGISHAALPHMKKESLLINVASLASYIPLGNFAVYGATKAFVLSFSTALAAELADTGIHVMSVCPGPVDTEFANVASNGAREKVVDGLSAQKVVAHALACARRGRHFAIFAPKWKFKAFMSRFVGRYFFARHTYIHEKRPSK
jgi:short-subunit dehydrogenase